MKVEKDFISAYLGEIDIFICSSGFEDRSAYLGINLNKIHIKKAIIFHIEDTYKLSEDNLSRIKENLPELETVIYPKNSPLVIYDKFYRLFEEFKTAADNKPNIVIDVTTFTREVLLILLKLLSSPDFITSFDVQLAYTPAESYAENASDLWLTKGIREIRSVLGYAGMHSPSKELLLILLSGFEEERANEIITSFEPNKLILGKASDKDSINSNLSDIANAKYQSLADNNRSILLDQFEFSCTDIKETQTQLNLMIEKYEQQFNVIISPLNNKISTLGAAICGLKNENIQICYASANQYNINDYSNGSDYFLVFSLTELIS
jgi:hypothetical protein